MLLFSLQKTCWELPLNTNFLLLVHFFMKRKCNCSILYFLVFICFVITFKHMHTSRTHTHIFIYVHIYYHLHSIYTHSLLFLLRLYHFFMWVIHIALERKDYFDWILNALTGRIWCLFLHITPFLVFFLPRILLNYFRWKSFCKQKKYTNLKKAVNIS